MMASMNEVWWLVEALGGRAQWIAWAQCAFWELKRDSVPIWVSLIPKVGTKH